MDQQVTNRCVKTGVMFRMFADASIRTGDLQWTPSDGFQITGIPIGVITHRGPDIIVHNIDMIERIGSIFRDTEAGVQIIGASDEFKQHCAQWSPWVFPQVSELPEVLP